MRSIAAFILAALLSLPAFADMAKPRAIEPAIKAQAPYGQGTLRKLLIKVYDATLWTDAPSWSMDSPFALALQYDLSIDAADIVDRSIDEMKRDSGFPGDKEKAYRAELARVIPEVAGRDVLTALCDPEKGVSFFHNDKPTGSIKDRELARRFMGIWLGDSTSEPRLRSALLGKAGG
jgi:hypothetical protein